jgi:hypothetical protein
MIVGADRDVDGKVFQQERQNSGARAGKSATTIGSRPDVPVDDSFFANVLACRASSLTAAPGTPLALETTGAASESHNLEKCDV